MFIFASICITNLEKTHRKFPTGVSLREHGKCRRPGKRESMTSLDGFDLLFNYVNEISSKDYLR